MRGKTKNSAWIAAGVLSVAAAALFLMIKVPFIYTVNDDLFMKNILSGAYLGMPEAHTVYMEYPLSLMLSGLYRMSAGVPWYGICFFLFHCISWGVIIGRVGIYKPVGAGVSLLLFTACGFYHVASMQFTVTAAVLGAAALVWFYTSDFEAPPRRVLAEQAVTAVLVFLSFNVRRNVLLMLVPIAGMLWLRKWLFEKERFSKETLIKYWGMAFMCLAAVAAAVVCYSAAYGSKEWKSYITYNDNATVLYDYYAWPDYNENRDLYEELDISYEAWQGAKEAYLLSADNGIDEGAMQALAERSKALYAEQNSFGSRIKEALGVIAERSFGETDRPLNLIVLGLYGMILLFVFINRKWQVFYSLGAVLCGRMFSWLYVVYEGRYPVRITQALYLAEAAVLMVIFWRECLKEDKEEKNVLKWSKMGALACFCMLLLLFSYTRIRHVYRENVWRLEESQDLYALKEYCGSHLENFYFVDSKSISGDTERIFDKKGSLFENYIVFGGWLSASPVYEEKLVIGQSADMEAALLNSGRVYAVFEEGAEYPTDYLENYFASKYKNFTMKEADRIDGGKNEFIVYQLEANGDLYE